MFTFVYQPSVMLVQPLKKGRFGMRILIFSRPALIFGLALGIMVLWAGAAPKTLSSESLIGGWGPIQGCPPCTGTFKHSPETDCGNAEYEGANMGCVSGIATICMNAESGSKHCSADDNIPCSGIPGESHPLCWVTHDAKCE